MRTRNVLNQLKVEIFEKITLCRFNLKAAKVENGSSNQEETKLICF